MRLLVAHGELFGLELVRKSGGALKRGTVYVLLDRMEDKGLVKSRQEEQPSDGYAGIARRLYRLTADGARVLRALELGELVVSGEWAT